VRQIKDIYSVKLLLRLLARRHKYQNIFTQGGSVGEIAFGVWPFRASKIVRRSIALLNLRCLASESTALPLAQLKVAVRELRKVPVMNIRDLPREVQEKEVVFISQNLNEYFCNHCECNLLDTLALYCGTVIVHPNSRGKSLKKYSKFRRKVFGLEEMFMQKNSLEMVYISLFSTALLNDSIQYQSIRIVPEQKICFSATCLRNRRQLYV
jgi:hypothetical protein